MPSKRDFNVVMIIPTGIGCEIGGHAGDANPVAKLLASVCDTLILHPNVVNASDINEMPENSLYVEGSILDRFLQGKIQLQKVLSNKILVVVNAPVRNETINAVSATRVTIGIDAEILELETRLVMVAKLGSEGASGVVYGWQELLQQIRKYDFDALAVATSIDCEKEVALNYFKNGGVNPWGGVEAIASKKIATELGRPVSHAPIETGDAEVKGYTEVVDPRMAAEIISECYLHSVLTGLHKAPRIGKGLDVGEVNCLVTPVGCIGPPHRACLERGITVIVVKENKTVLNDPIPDEFILVENYLEAAGLLVAIKAGVHPSSVRRPIEPTVVIKTKIHEVVEGGDAGGE